MLLDEILLLCWNEKSQRLIPKRNLNWIKINHFDLYNKIVLSFPTITKISIICGYLKNNILNESEIPLCKVCKMNKVIYNRVTNKVLLYCSNKCTIKSIEVQEKTKHTCLKKYGKRFNNTNSSYKLGDHYLHKHLKNLDDVGNEELMYALQESGDWKKIATHFNLTINSHSSAHKFMKKYGYELKRTIISQPENDLIEFIKSLGIRYITNDRQLIKPYELDIYLPDYNLAIELNGIYWHSSNNINDDKEFKIKHIRKTNLCESKGVHLLHIFENEWTDENLKSIWKSVILYKLNMSNRIYARKCIIAKIDNKDAASFCKENHLQGSTGSLFSYGLFYNNTLVMVATFGKSRYSNAEYELIRMCSLKNYCIVGGASKLLKNIDIINKTCISYGNRRWCSNINNVYEKIATFSHISDPCYWYIKNGKIYHRSAFMKHKLKNILLKFNNDLTETENMYNNGYSRIWDSGNLVYILDTK